MHTLLISVSVSHTRVSEQIQLSFSLSLISFVNPSLSCPCAGYTISLVVPYHIHRQFIHFAFVAPYNDWSSHVTLDINVIRHYTLRYLLALGSRHPRKLWYASLLRICFTYHYFLRPVELSYNYFQWLLQHSIRGSHIFLLTIISHIRSTVSLLSLRWHFIRF